MSESLSLPPLFEALSPDIQALLLQTGSLRTLRSGETLFRTGDSADFWFYLLSGAVDVSRSGQDSDPASVEAVVRRILPGEMGGYTSLTLGQPRSATLRAASDTQLFILPKPAFLSLLDKAAFAQCILASACKALRAEHSIGATSLNADCFRVACFDTKAYDRESLEAVLQTSKPALTHFSEFQFSWLTPRLDVRTAELAQGHHAVCAFVNDNISRATLSRLAELGVRFIALRCAGFNQVDLKAAQEFGIDVCRVPAYSPHAVAEHAVALLLALNRKLTRAHSRIQDGNFSLVGLVGSNLHGKTAGLIGLGKIGRALASILRGFGMRVLAVDPALTREQLAQDPTLAGIELCALEPLLAESDVLSLHAPLTPETHHLLNAERFLRMKRGAHLINTSRGGLVDTHALLDALKSGQVGAAGLDVYEEESQYFFEDRSSGVITDDLLARLLSMNNVLITSHQGFLTQEALHNIAETTLQNLTAFANGTTLPNRLSTT